MCLIDPAEATDIDPPEGFKAETVVAGEPLADARAMAITADGATMFVADKGTYDSGDPEQWDGKIVKVDLTARTMSIFFTVLPQPDDLLMGDGRSLTGTDLIAADHNYQNIDYGGEP